MTWTDWVISLGLIALVLRQVRGRTLTVGGLLWPVGLVVWAGFEYLGGFPGYASDREFALCLAVVGLALGLGCGALTEVHQDGEQVIARASLPAAALWIIGMASRLAFGIVALHGGAEAIGRLSMKLDLHSEDTWPTALILMALCEVVSRTALLLWKHRAASRELAEAVAAKAGDGAGAGPQAGGDPDPAAPSDPPRTGTGGPADRADPHSGTGGGKPLERPGLVGGGARDDAAR